MNSHDQVSLFIFFMTILLHSLRIRFWFVFASSMRLLSCRKSYLVFGRRWRLSWIGHGLFRVWAGRFWVRWANRLWERTVGVFRRWVVFFFFFWFFGYASSYNKIRMYYVGLLCGALLESPGFSRSFYDCERPADWEIELLLLLWEMLIQSCKYPLSYFNLLFLTTSVGCFSVGFLGLIQAFSAKIPDTLQSSHVLF